MQAHDYLIDQIIDLEAYVDKMSMHQFDREIIETYIKSIRILANEIRNDIDHENKPKYDFFGKDEVMQALDKLTIRTQ